MTDKVLDCLGVAGVRAVRPAWIHRCAARWEHLPEDAFAPLDGAGQPCWEQARPPPPSLPYKVDTSRPSLRTNWTRLVPFWRRAPPPGAPGASRGGRVRPCCVCLSLHLRPDG